MRAETIGERNCSKITAVSFISNADVTDRQQVDYLADKEVYKKVINQLPKNKKV